jgi:hypothetical protein
VIDVIFLNARPQQYFTFALVAMRYATLIFVKMAGACATSPAQLLCLGQRALTALLTRALGFMDQRVSVFAGTENVI